MKKERKLKRKRVNIETLTLNLEKNPTGSAAIKNLLKKKRLEKLVTNPRRYRKQE